MLAPDDIRRRAQTRYADFLRSVVNGTAFFPLPVRFGKPSPTEDFAKLRREINALTEANLGCHIDWTEVNSRRWGKQRLPERVEFANETSYLRTLGKTKEVTRFRESLALTRERCPSLISFFQERPLDVVELADAWLGLLEVCYYLQRHPRPNLYARELPLSVDTKFVERHQSVLTRLLTIALPPDATVESERFEERFGLRFDEPQIRLRLLDESLRVPLGIPFDDVSLPLNQFRNLGWKKLRVLVSENKMTFLTLPSTPRTVGIWGAGNAAALLHNVPWLANCDLFYWGDVDVQGFEILTRLREVFPKTQSIMMDAAIMNCFRELCRPGIPSKVKIKLRLTNSEEKARELACASNLRLEQEKIPNQFATAAINGALSTRCGLE
ncbi:MAG: hypothetical protein EPO07_13295 [Verrucomicrobia bacterium]|nr:MAG: hypothetical protein EPO07_13295 [Verrucomicrobiota bacterium]